MDPLSVAAAAAGLWKTSCEIAKIMYKITDRTSTVNKRLADFASEVNSVSRILQAITSTLNDRRLPLGESSSSPDVWIALLGAIDDLRLYFNKLQAKLNNIQAKSENYTLFKLAIRAFELSLSQENIDNLRSFLVGHKLSLNIALQIVQIYTQRSLPTAEPSDILLQVSRLISMIAKLPKAEGNSRTDLEHGNIGRSPEAASRNIARLRNTAIVVASEASVYAGSTTGSELGDPLDSNRADRIQNWLTLSNVVEKGEARRSGIGTKTHPNIFSEGICSSAEATTTDGFDITDIDLQQETTQPKPIEDMLAQVSESSLSPNPEALYPTAQDISPSPELDRSFADPKFCQHANNYHLLKFYHQLHAIVCWLLILSLGFSILEVLLYPGNLREHNLETERPFTISLAAVTIGYVPTRAIVSWARKRKLVFSFTPRIFIWHCTSEILLL